MEGWLVEEGSGVTRRIHHLYSVQYNKQHLKESYSTQIRGKTENDSSNNINKSKSPIEYV